MQSAPQLDTFYDVATGVVEQEPAPVTIWQAAADDDSVRVRAVLSTNPGAKDTHCAVFGHTPAHHACGRDSVGALAVLAEYHADLNRPAVRGVTPTFIAAATGSVRCLRFLVAHGGRFSDRYRDLTPLDWLLAPQRMTRTHFETRLQGSRLETAKILVLAGADAASSSIPHYHSRSMLLEWARWELQQEESWRLWLLGAAATGVRSTASRLDIGGVTRRVGGFVPRHSRQELQHLNRAVSTWEEEEIEEAIYETSWIGVST